MIMRCGAGQTTHGDRTGEQGGIRLSALVDLGLRGIVHRTGDRGDASGLAGLLYPMKPDRHNAQRCTWDGGPHSSGIVGFKPKVTILLRHFAIVGCPPDASVPHGSVAVVEDLLRRGAAF
jgi:hypothetical protein